jgi:hypothetical protein
MFGNDPRDLAATLATMEKIARERSNFDQIEAKDKFRQYLSQDKRFAEYNADALIDRVMHCKNQGAILDLDDPQLKGREKRPLSW